jgi:pilus assembly protein CpaD
MRAVMKKDPTMRSKLALIALASALGGCVAGAPAKPDRGVSVVNIPVVTTAEYVFDASAPGGSLAPGEGERLNAWFQSLGVGYGDSIYVDGDYGGRARAQVAEIVGRYGLLMQAGAPVTAGSVAPDTVRVVVSRRRATVPNCPNWDRDGQANYENRTFPNLGCAVNSNLAAMVADPVDLIHGREDGGVPNPETVTKAVESYRKASPTGGKALQSVNTKGN